MSEFRHNQMAKPSLWLGLTVLAFTIVLIILIFLLVFQVFIQDLPPTFTEIIEGARDSPWSLFQPIPGQLCKVYVGGVPSAPGGLSSESPGGTQITTTCTPDNGIALILTRRVCERDGCIDLNGIPREIGYVEEQYNDCSRLFSCSAFDDPNCFQAVPMCSFQGITTAQIMSNGVCLQTLGFTAPTGVGSNDCLSLTNSNNYIQRFNFVPLAPTTFGQPYAITDIITRRCVVPNSANTYVTLGPCAGGWYITPQTTTQISVGGVLFPANVPSQLLYSPNLAVGPLVWSSSFNILQTLTVFKVLIGNALRDFIPACNLVPSDVLTGIPPCSPFITKITPQGKLLGGPIV